MADEERGLEGDGPFWRRVESPGAGLSLRQVTDLYVAYAQVLDSQPDFSAWNIFGTHPAVDARHEDGSMCHHSLTRFIIWYGQAVSESDASGYLELETLIDPSLTGQTPSVLV
jgi:hypothetical protein